MQIKPSVAAILAAFALAGSPAAFANTPAATTTASSASVQKVTTVEGITEYRLANGLRVLLAPDASKATTTVNLTYLVGSRHENYGETGMAHLLEHMTFKGTPNRGNIMQELGKRGMDFNGTTWFDRTNYYETFAASDDNLQWALEMEADRMVNSTIARQDLDTEFSVVRNELEMGDNSPRDALWARMTSVAYDWHNYGKPTIGSRSDVENVSIDRLQAFYRKYYQPDNAVLVVAGKFDEAKTLALIEKQFGAIPKPSRALERTYTQDSVQDGAREVTVSRVGETTLLGALYHTSAGAHADAAAMAALSEILASTPNGRLHKTLVEGKKASGVESWNVALTEPGYILFWAELAKTQSSAEARKKMLDVIENIKQKPITETELKQAKASLLNGIDKTINDPRTLGVKLSEAIAKGDWRLFFLQRDQIEALSVAEVQKVAENYFKESNRTFGQFVPTKTPNRITMPATPDVTKLVADYKGRAAAVEGEKFDSSPTNIDQRTQRFTLANGMKVAFTPKKTRGETVSGAIRLQLGELASLSGQRSYAAATAEMLSRGAGKLSRQQLQSKFDELKAKVSISGRGQHVDVQFETVRKNLPELLTVLRDVLRAPTFPASELEQMKTEQITSIQRDSVEPQPIALLAWLRHWNDYKKDDIRYTPDFTELLAETKALNLGVVKGFYQKFYGAQDGELSLVGDFDAKASEDQIKSLFGDWKAKNRYARIADPVNEPKADSKSIETPDKANAFYVASLPIKLNDQAADYPAMLLVQEVLGGGIKSRLLDRLRQKDGISYYAGSRLQVSSHETAGTLLLIAIYAPQNLPKLQAGVKEELERFVVNGISAEELADAKKGLLQQRQISRAEDSTLAAMHLDQLDRHRTMKFTAELDARIETVTLDDVNAAIKKYIDPARFAHVYAGDFAQAAKATKTAAQGQ